MFGRGSGDTRTVELVDDAGRTERVLSRPGGDLVDGRVWAMTVPGDWRGGQLRSVGADGIRRGSPRDAAGAFDRLDAMQRLDLEPR